MGRGRQDAELGQARTDLAFSTTGPHLLTWVNKHNLTPQTGGT